MTYLIWGTLNNDNIKFFCDRFVAKPSSHKSNFLKHNLFSSQIFQPLEIFHWGLIYFCKIKEKKQSAILDFFFHVSDPNWV